MQSNVTSWAIALTQHRQAERREPISGRAEFEDCGKAGAGPILAFSRFGATIYADITRRARVLSAESLGERTDFQGPIRLEMVVPAHKAASGEVDGPRPPQATNHL